MTRRAWRTIRVATCSSRYGSVLGSATARWPSSSVNEKPQIQALDHTAPTLPLRSGLAERRTHDYVRHGVTDLFAALETATGRVLGGCFARHRHDEFLVFLKQVAHAWPRRELHVVVDNASTHSHAEVTAWLARHPRITLHFTPTSASWMNQVETFFGLLTRQALRRGSFASAWTWSPRSGGTSRRGTLAAIRLPGSRRPPAAGQHARREPALAPTVAMACPRRQYEMSKANRITPA